MQSSKLRVYVLYSDISKRSDNGKAIAGAKDFKKKAGKPSGVLEHFEGNDFKDLRTGLHHPLRAGQG